MSTLQSAPSTSFAVKLLVSDGEFRPKECSPVGLWYALSVLAKGSEGCTQRELLQFLDESGSIKSIEQKLLAIKEFRALELSLGLFAQEGIAWKSPFLQSMKSFYPKIQVAPSPFQTPEKALCQINSWANEATRGEIPELLQKEDIDSKTVAFLLSALYFSQTWTEPFKKEASDWRPFSIGASTKLVRTMRSLEHLPYTTCSFGQYIEKSLVKGKDGGDYVVEFFLPSCTLHEEELKLALSLCRKQAAYQLVSLSLPQSKGKSTCVWNDWLKKHGVSSLFTDRAAFSLLSYSPLSVQQISEGATVSITESGVIVADVVAVSFRLTSCGPIDPTIELHFDKPFFFLVREKKSDTVIACSYIGSFKQLLEQPAR